MKKQIFPLAALFFLISSCHNMERSSISPGIKKHIPENGKYYFTIKSQTKIAMDYEGTEIDNDTRSTAGIRYETYKDSSGSSFIKITYDRLVIELKSKGREYTIDASDSNATDAMSSVFNAIIGASMTVHLGPDGKVASIQGNKELREKMLATANKLDPNTAQLLKQQLDKFIGEDFVRNSFQQGFAILPDSVVHVGDTWKSTGTESGDLPFESSTTYTLKSLDTETAEIGSASVIKNTSGQTITTMGYPVSSDLTGTQHGHYRLDAKMGVITQSDITSAIKGTMQVMDVQVPVTIDIKRTIVSRRM